MKKLLTTILLTLLTIANVQMATVAYANNGTPEPDTGEFMRTIIPKPSNLPGPSVGQQKNETVKNILVEKVLPRFAVGTISLAGGLAVVFVLIGSVRMITAYGEEESIDKAKKQVTYGLVGFVIALLSYVIVSIIINIDFASDTTSRLQDPVTTESQ